MFGRKKLSKDIPPIDIRYKPVKGFWGKTKMVPRSKREQRKIKKEIMKRRSDLIFVDDLNEWNSYKEPDSLDYISEMEEMAELFEDWL